MARFRPADQQVIACREQSRLGIEALSRGQTKEAETRLQHAIRGCPHDAEARRGLAQVHWSLGQYESAITQMDVAVRLSGDDPLWTVELGNMLLARDKLAAADECARRAVDRNPRLGSGWALLGDIRMARGEAVQAQDAYHRALAAEGCPHRVLLSLASVYEQQGRWQRALSMLRRVEDATGSEPCPPDLRLRIGIVLQAMQRHHDAMSEFQLARHSMGDQPELLRRMASSCQAIGQWGQAEQLMALAVQLDSSPVQTASLNDAVVHANETTTVHP